MSGDVRETDCDAATKSVAIAICGQVRRHDGGCMCERSHADPCAAMVLAACEAERTIEARRISEAIT